MRDIIFYYNLKKHRFLYKFRINIDEINSKEFQSSIYFIEKAILTVEQQTNIVGRFSNPPTMMKPFLVIYTEYYLYIRVVYQLPNGTDFLDTYCQEDTSNQKHTRYVDSQ